MSYHAKLSPSSAYRWMRCTASVGQSEGIVDDSNEHARWGTAAHLVASESLEDNVDASMFLGREVLFCKDADGKRFENFRERIETSAEAIAAFSLEHVVKVDDEIVECAQAYVDFVRELVQTTGGTLLVEQRVPIGHITGEQGAGGTSDAIILAPKTLYVVDLKGGMGKVVAWDMVKPSLPDPITGEMQPPVFAPNSQLATYAGGALHEHALLNDFETVTMIIVQPRLNHVSEFSMSISELTKYLEDVSAAAEATRSNPTFVPGDHCTFCKGRETCQARTDFVLTTALDGFNDVHDPAQIAAAAPRQCAGNMLGVLYSKLGMIREWCDDVGSRVYSALQQGEPVVREDGIAYKLVMGKKGARAWTSAEQAEALLKSFRLRQEEMYDFSLISPTTADKLAHPKAPKGKEPPTPAIGKRQWTKLESIIGQSDGKPTIALESDPHPAVPAAADGFEDTSSQTATDTVDYFN